MSSGSGQHSSGPKQHSTESRHSVAVWRAEREGRRVKTTLLWSQATGYESLP